MKTLLSWCLVLLSFTSLAQSIAKNEIPFQLLPSGHLLVKATIDGVDGNFIFDTGAGLTVVTKTYFDKLKHTHKEDGGYTGFRATGERIDIDLYKVTNFQLGSFTKAEEEISYLDANFGGVDGIIALKLLETQPFTIDYNKSVLRLEKAADLAAIRKTARKVPVQLEQSRNKSLTLFSYFKVNDTLTLQMSLDAGAGKDVYRLNAKYLKPLGVDTNDTLHVKKIEKRSEISSTFSSTIYIAPVAQLASSTQPAIAVKDIRAQFVDGLIYDGIMWINWLGKQITFDLAGEALWIRS